ncbi:hypothetical protein GTQ43_31145 [Nostoc sp. KVJ3]|uniref:hypothetical protein n=1 Tax=Nostoc sp. KVJ3 TaxID=457945 RepID=UPI00223868BB|nr:hypothetical protein [Nostoc sp. KVJ3]MCW5318060.1 hypothetical protein [Nostoc sp. KVJ3]
MKINNFCCFMIRIGLTLAVPVGILTPPVIAQTVSPSPSSVVISYQFPKEGITYITNGSLTYNGVVYPPNKISIVNSGIGIQLTVTTANGVDTLTKFTLILPNNLIQNSAKITAVGIIDNFLAPNKNNDFYSLLNGTATVIVVDPPH